MSTFGTAVQQPATRHRKRHEPAHTQLHDRCWQVCFQLVRRHKPERLTRVKVMMASHHHSCQRVMLTPFKWVKQPGPCPSPGLMPGTRPDYLQQAHSLTACLTDAGQC